MDATLTVPENIKLTETLDYGMIKQLSGMYSEMIAHERDIVLLCHTRMSS